MTTEPATTQTDVAPALPRLALVCAASRRDVLQDRLAASPCLDDGSLPWRTVFGARTAADAFNPVMDAVLAQRAADWLIWAHQDVYLPEGWDSAFAAGLQESLRRWPQTLVAGVYGVRGFGPQAQRCGHVLDRGDLLREEAALPCPVDSLDELLVAVRVDSGLRMDPNLGFDFYATDLALQAQHRGGMAVVLDACCEHWSETPRHPTLARVLRSRIGQSGDRFERKWAHRLPLSTPCFAIDSPGAVARALEAFS